VVLLLKKRSLLLAAIIVFVVLFGCAKKEVTPKERDLLQIKSDAGHPTKKVILICVDSLMAQAIDAGIKQHKLPTFKFLSEQGQYYKDVVSSFPTMSVTIDSSLLTGTFPDKHHVPGLL
jgi:predicted AlkP superfamily pyrophosphatase or phosphodiesterase